MPVKPVKVFIALMAGLVLAGMLAIATKPDEAAHHRAIDARVATGKPFSTPIGLRELREHGPIYGDGIFWSATCMKDQSVSVGAFGQVYIFGS